MGGFHRFALLCGLLQGPAKKPFMFVTFVNHSCFYFVAWIVEWIACTGLNFFILGLLNFFAIFTQ